MNLSKNLKAVRHAKSFSQQRLADASGVSIRTIQRIEKGLSVGSAYTVDALAKALDVEIKELLTQNSSNQSLKEENIDWLRLMNLSSLSVILIPLFNILMPLIIFWKNRSQGTHNRYARKILNFQILWTLGTIILITLVPIILLLLFNPLQGGSIPLAIPVYFISVLLNVYVTIRIAIAINNGSNTLEMIPNLL
jgi:XRE family transcriptional regulator, regulator of sulfur utilization